MLKPIITIKEAGKILGNKTGEVKITLDLGKSSTNVKIEGKFVIIGKDRIPIDDFKKVKEDKCYFVEKNSLNLLAFFSEESNLYYKLFPSNDWPTLTLSSAPMHRHTHISPREDTKLKIDEIEPVKGNVLDTCCGLGYTAIMAAKKANEVNVFERDEYVLEIAKMNPYSQEIFNNKKIRLYVKDVFMGIKEFKNQYFDRVIHDPPTYKLSPELYSESFYEDLYRVMKQGAILYHYAPNPHKTKGEEFHKKIMALLKKVGFKDIEHHEKSSGVRAVK